MCFWWGWGLGACLAFDTMLNHKVGGLLEPKIKKKKHVVCERPLTSFRN